MTSHAEIQRAATEITTALETFRKHVERNGRAVAPLTSMVEDLMRFCVWTGQDGSRFDGPTQVDDRDGMAPLALTYREAADALRVSESAIKREVRAGHLPVFHIGAAARIRVADLADYVARQDASEPPDADAEPASPSASGAPPVPSGTRRTPQPEEAFSA
jgi:excisionase family DNA binding protein